MKGRRLDVDSGICTRSRARIQAEHWNYVPASTKIFSLLADTLIEAKEGVEGGDEEDSWQSESEDNLTDSSLKWATTLTSNKALKNMWPDSISKVHKYLFSKDEESSALIDPHLTELDLTNHICSQFRHIAEHDKPLFDSCCHTLNASQLQAVMACFWIL